jgi:threonine dehydrogenase-like Zn-dependent dehydrogenase
LFFEGKKKKKMMKAVVYKGVNNVKVENVPRPVLEQPTDVILRVTSTAICGSDLHLYGGFVPSIKAGDILGHEFMGEIVQVGEKVKKLAIGDRVIVPAIIACGNCFFCRRNEHALCDNSNPKKEIAEKAMGYAPAGLFGYTDMFGGFAGGQAEYVRVPFADVGAFKVPSNLSDEKVLFLTDIYPTGYMAALNCDIEKGDTVAIWGAGPVGQFALRCALLLGAGKVIAIDRSKERLAMAVEGGAQVLNYEDGDVLSQLKRMTDGRGPDCCIDAVGTEAHGAGGLKESIMHTIDKAKQMLSLESDRPAAIRQILLCCRKGGRVSIPGMYGGVVDNFPLGFAFNKGLTLKMGPTHVQAYLPKLLAWVEEGKIDPSFVITHRLKLQDAAEGYALFQNKDHKCIKVILTP